MYKISNLEDNSNVKVIDQMGCVKVVEYQSDLSVKPDDAAAVYFAQKMNIKRRQVMIELNDNSFILQSGAMQWVAGNITSGSGIKGLGDLVGKMLSSKVTKESTVKPEYSGNGTIMLEPTYKHILLVDINQWGSMVIEDGMFLACDGQISIKTAMRKTLSASLAGNEGLFNLSLQGNGVAVLESPVPKEELIEVTLDNDELKIDGSMAVAWSRSLEFTVGKSGRTVISSAINGEGLVNIYRGTGKVWMAPTR
jgi:uncharacterized protein (AIM24 family)